MGKPEEQEETVASEQVLFLPAGISLPPPHELHSGVQDAGIRSAALFLLGLHRGPRCGAGLVLLALPLLGPTQELCCCGNRLHATTEPGPCHLFAQIRVCEPW